MKIGVVLAGGASKGAYEAGVLTALEEYFGMDSIHCVSTASVGALIAEAHGSGNAQQLADVWNGIDTKKNGSFFLSYSGNEEILSLVDTVLDNRKHLQYEHYVSIWNFTKSCVEYIPFHTLNIEELKQYVRAAIAIPLFTSGVTIDENKYLDGAFLDNIPVFPLLEKDLDFIFCIYFDNCNYIFENEGFDKKIIKLFDFPNKKMLEMMQYSSSAFNQMSQYGYDYTMRIIKELFDNASDKAQIYDRIEQMEKNRVCTYKPRLTADIVLNNINTVAKRYSKKLSLRKKKS